MKPRQRKYTLTIQRVDGGWALFAWYDFKNNCADEDRNISHRTFVVTSRWYEKHKTWVLP